MSSQIEANVPVYTGPFIKFFEFIQTHPLSSPTSESVVLQRLKILASASNHFIKFRMIDDETYHIFSSHETIGDDIVIGDVKVGTIVPFRSAIFTVKDGFRFLDWSIRRITNILNVDFLTKINDPTILAHESYEGTIIVARKNDNSWTFRTTSCHDASESYFGSEQSHYELFEKIAGQDLNIKMDTLSEQYEGNKYYVFVLVSKEQQHLCDYDKSKIILINVRDTITHDESIIKDPSDWYEVSKPVTCAEVLASLNSEKTFNDSPLKIQGYVLQDSNMAMYRTYTCAYHYGSLQVPNHSNMLLNAIHCYLRGSFMSLVKLKNIKEDESRILFGQAKQIIFGIRNLLAYMFTVFTKFSVKNVETTVNGNKSFKMTKSYDKLNGDFYTQLFKITEDTEYLQHYMKVLPLLQRYSIVSKGFTESTELALDTEKYLRTLAYDSNTIQLFFDMLYNFKSFLEHLKSVTNDYNSKNSTKIKMFNFKDEVRFFETFNRYLTKTEPEPEEPVLDDSRTINVETNIASSQASI
jgi:hypothetical protein